MLNITIGLVYECTNDEIIINFFLVVVYIHCFECVSLKFNADILYIVVFLKNAMRVIENLNHS